MKKLKKKQLIGYIQNIYIYIYRVIFKTRFNVFLSQLFERNPEERLGMENCPSGPIRQHAFFAKVDFDKLEKRQVKPPFEPKIVRASTYCYPHNSYISKYKTKFNPT